MLGARPLLSFAPVIRSLRRVVTASLVLGTSVAIAQPQPAPEQPAPAPGPALEILVRGHVIDAFGKPIKGATVTVEGGTSTAKTDRDGFFKLTAAVGATLLVDEPRYDNGLATVTGDVLDDIVMLTTSQTTETIEVTGEGPAEAPGAAKLDRQELQRIPGTGGDVVRALTIMPGVVNLQLPLGYNGVVIRGSSPQDSKIFIDDFEVPVLFHNIGFRAIVPAESIASLDYIPGGFDVAYGRASSGIVNLTTRAGSDKRTEQAEVSFIDGGVIAQGPLGKATTYLLALRRSTIDFILPAIIPSSVDLSLTTVPRYWDEQLRIDHKLNEHWGLSLSNVGTDDIFELVASKNDSAKDKRFFNRTRFARLTAAARYRNGEYAANLALSGLLQEFTFEIGRYQFIKAKVAQITPRVEFTRSLKHWAGLADVVWRLGGESQTSRNGIKIALPIEPREGEPQPAVDPMDTSTRFDGHVVSPDLAAWTAVSANLDPKIRGTLGVRAEAFLRPGQALLQPRADLAWKLVNHWTARVSGGAFSRPPEYQSELLSETAQAERSKQAIGGLQFEPKDGIRVQGSVYYTDRTQLITHEPDNSLGNNGRGTTKGAELLGTYRGGPWFAWLSYSYSHSTRVDHPGDVRRLFTFDQPHSMNAALSWKHGNWQLGGRFQLYSGLPYTPPTGAVYDSDRDLYIPIFGPPNSQRAPLHHQLDLRVDHTWHGALEITGFIDVQNVYMNDSTVTYFYSYDYSKRAAFKSIPIIPSIGIRGVL